MPYKGVWLGSRGVLRGAHLPLAARREALSSGCPEDAPYSSVHVHANYLPKTEQTVRAVTLPVAAY